jgi:SAM-dependent methyltransferase
VKTTTAERPVLTRRATRRWLPALARRTPHLLSAYLVPGRVSPRLREATMLGVTSVNRCQACERFHGRWAAANGLRVDEPASLTPDEAAAYAYGQALAVAGPSGVALPAGMSLRHVRELHAAGLMIEMANLAGNRFLPEPGADRRPQIGGPWTARAYDLAMRAADGAGLGRARKRIAGGASGDVLEIGIGTGLNLVAYPRSASLRGLDPSGPALAVAAERARGLTRSIELARGDAADLPYPDDSFDTVVGTFVLCSVDDVPGTLLEARRVLRVGGTVRFLEHARSDHGAIARLQGRLAPAWGRAAGGCRLDHDVAGSLEDAGLRIVERRSRAGGLLVEIVARA